MVSHTSTYKEKAINIKLLDKYLRSKKNYDLVYERIYSYWIHGKNVLRGTVLLMQQSSQVQMLKCCRRLGNKCFHVFSMSRESI